MNQEKWAAVWKSILWGICMLLFPILSGTLAAVFSLEAVETLFLQGTFMLFALLIPLFFILRKKWSWREIGFAKIDAGACKKVLYFLPLLAVFLPAAVKGFHVKSAIYVLGNIYLYFMVGVAEEVYFRGVIPQYLKRAFSRKGVVLLSTVIFGLGHMAAAFTAGNGLEVFLTVLNAFVFGWLAIEMTVISQNIAPAVFLHFLFDFETKIVVMQGKELLIAECIRGGILAAGAVWLTVAANRNKTPGSLVTN